MDMSHFLALPRELRDQILEHVLLKDTNTITMLPNFDCHKNEISACPPAISAVCHQLRAETLPLFFGENTFTAQLDNAPDLSTALAWLNALGDDNICHLKKLVLCGWTSIPFGHMISRRWLRVNFDLKDRRVEIPATGGNDQASRVEHPEHYQKSSTFSDVLSAFDRVNVALDGRPFDVASLSKLFEGFNLLCTGY